MQTKGIVKEEAGEDPGCSDDPGMLVDDDGNAAQGWTDQALA